MKNFIAKMGAVLLALGTVMALSGCGEDSGTSSEVENETSPNVNMGSMVDSRDGKTYKTVKIGDQEWMAENLNYQTGESKCYRNEPENCEKYGRLYVWREAVTACPDGWHLPSKEEFEELEKLAGQKAGDIEKSGTVLKSTTGWIDNDGKSGNGTDGLGFGALPAGDVSDDDYFYFEGYSAAFWSSTENASGSWPSKEDCSGNAFGLNLTHSYKGASLDDTCMDDGFSVRCVKNP